MPSELHAIPILHKVPLTTRVLGQTHTHTRSIARRRHQGDASHGSIFSPPPRNTPRPAPTTISSSAPIQLNRDLNNHHDAHVVGGVLLVVGHVNQRHHELDLVAAARAAQSQRAAAHQRRRVPKLTFFHLLKSSPVEGSHLKSLQVTVAVQAHPSFTMVAGL